MPFIQIYLLEGRSEEQKKAVIREVTASVCNVLEVPAERVRVWIHDVPTTNWGIGGVTAKELGR
jgi:4-oxalocrotonate tautomerase